ncbi:MAG: hypothetical protein A2787_09510 [Omnitrophica WOR_2 bacterium RIFCSPHIGHO2_01_FULL_48_9]|nr:MAG: hypothetical protein A3D10_06415 [Omnitrophica WOR_2 bacterium RIFCSPHIGHO2_02_FULL_48_11]OGX31904.1 MAG: hypothetical protein A2787_09510 [Omnitrophica WOR_2 bacterium RIFCSPHIGHO2_01_FULL_48_9]
MAIPHYKITTSIEAIAHSIKIDHYVYHWFSQLIVHPRIKEKLKTSPDLLSVYKYLKLITLSELLLYLAFFILVILFFSLRQWPLVIFLAAVNLGLLFLSLKEKTAIARLGIGVLTQDYSAEQIAQMTLFQICEIYSRQLNIPSLVDTVFALDDTLKKILIWTYILTVFIYPLNSWQVLGSLVLSYWLMRWILNLGYFYYRIR